jgi:ATP-binding cassette subfamily F protein 3
MAIVSLQDVEVSFGAEDVICGVTCELNAGDRVGLIGRNGAGKTTLLEVIAGDVSPTSGRRSIARTTRQAEATGNATIEEEALSALDHLVGLERDLAAAAHDLSAGVAGAEERYAVLHDRLEASGTGFSYRARLAEVLHGLGFPEDAWPTPVAQLSGGQRSRLALAKALLSEPDLLLMDEPTNHLDLDALSWLDGFLARWPHTLLVTSHDRYFLDRVATQIWLVTQDGRLATYRGNYTKSEQQRQADLERQQKDYEAQQEFIAREQDFIRRYGAGQRAREAQGRAKRLARMERVEAVRSERDAKFSFKSARSGNIVLQGKDVITGYGEQRIAEAGDLEVWRGDRIALIGPNGSGKTTLLRTIAGELAPAAGTLRVGSAVTVAHYWQEAEDLDNKGMVLDEILRFPGMQMQDARNHLGRFLFSGDDVLKQVGDLSGGERSRLALAKLVLAEANLLLLDEPTNHLDIPSRESLERALESYAGTLLFASHDRRLIASIATRLWVINRGRLTVFEGTYDEYVEQQAAKAAIAATAPRPAITITPHQPKRSTYAARRQAEALQQLEADIARREAELAALGEQINDASARGDMRELERLGETFRATQAALDELMARWLEASEALATP